MTAASSPGTPGEIDFGSGGGALRCMARISATVSASKGFPGGHLEDHESQCIDVGSFVERAERDLFGRRVMRSADKHTLLGEALLADQAGETEIREVRFAILIHQDVPGFDVAVENVVFVRGCQRRCELRGDLRTSEAGSAPHSEILLASVPPLIHCMVM